MERLKKKYESSMQELSIHKDFMLEDEPQTFQRFMKFEKAELAKLEEMKNEAE